MVTPEKQRAYAREWIRNRRKIWFDTNGPCVQCGSWERLELDHVDPSTKIASAIWSWREERRLVELAKCQVLCHDCHLKKTKTEHVRGSRCGPSILTEDQVLAIKQELEQGVRQCNVARKFGIDKRHVWEIAHEKTWGWLKISQ